MKWVIKTLLLTMALVTTEVVAMGQAANFKAMYLYNFARNTLWPSTTTYDGNAFVITVVGDNEVGMALAKLLKSKKVGEREVAIKQATTINQITTSQVIYLGESKSDQIHKLAEEMAGSNVLIVSGKSGWCAYGAGISFVNKGGSLSYEVSEANIKKHGLACQSQIMRAGAIVD